MTIAEEWGISGFPNIVDDGPVHIRFGVFDHPTAVAVSAGGSLAMTTGEIDAEGVFDLIDEAETQNR